MQTRLCHDSHMAQPLLDNKGVFGNAVNVFWAAAAYNFKRTMRGLAALVEKISGMLCLHNIPLEYAF